jgi:hypothetical protein
MRGRPPPLQRCATARRNWPPVLAASQFTAYLCQQHGCALRACNATAEERPKAEYFMLVSTLAEADCVVAALQLRHAGQQAAHARHLPDRARV